MTPRGHVDRLRGHLTFWVAGAISGHRGSLPVTGGPFLAGKWEIILSSVFFSSLETLFKSLLKWYFSVQIPLIIVIFHSVNILSIQGSIFEKTMFPSSKAKFVQNVVKTVPVSSSQNGLVMVGNGPIAKGSDTQWPEMTPSYRKWSPVTGNYPPNDRKWPTMTGNDWVFDSALAPSGQ